MGGKVFSSGQRALFTPRITREVYQYTRHQCFAALKPLFPLVKCPIEPPEKATFGDVDILACLEGSSFAADEISDPEKTAVWAAVEKQLQVVRTYQRTSLVKYFAIPWPTMLTTQMLARQLASEAAPAPAGGDKAVGCLDKAVASIGDLAKLEAARKLRYIQVDIQLCATQKELEWSNFKLAHGDLWCIVGAIIRPYGLLINNTALCIVIPETESRRKKACVFLTDKPIEILDFLGLPHENGEWERPFASIEELFEYAVRCRWSFLRPREGGGDHSIKKSAALRDGKTATSHKSHPQQIRQRKRKRIILDRWYDEFIPACGAAGRVVAVPAAVRDEVRAAAFKAFPGTETAYYAHLAAIRAEDARLFVRNTLIKKDACLPKWIAHVLPAPQEGGCGIVEDIEEGWRDTLRSALIKIVIHQNCNGFEGVVGGVAPPARLRDEGGALRVDEVKAWIAENWEAVGRVAWREKRARTSEAFRAMKEQRKEEKAAEDEASAAVAGTDKT